MSTVKVQGNAGGTGSITLASPNTNNNRTIELPDVDGTAVVANSSGNVGIGTSSPSSILHISKDETTAYNGSATDGQLSVGATAFVQQIGGGSNNAISQLVFQPRTGYPYNRIVSSGGSAPYMTFVTNNAERARIDSSGNLLVNTTSATGSSKFVVAADTTTANPITVSNTRSTAATDYSILFYRNASLVGSIQTSLSATSYVTSSDYRLKENIAPMTGALQKVAQLKPCTYTWKLDGSNGQGFIAHELQEVVPDCVTGEKDAVDADGNPKYQGIDTSFLVATLTAAIQEQQAIIEQLRADVEALKGAA